MSSQRHIYMVVTVVHIRNVVDQIDVVEKENVVGYNFVFYT